MKYIRTQNRKQLIPITEAIVLTDNIIYHGERTVLGEYNSNSTAMKVMNKIVNFIDTDQYIMTERSPQIVKKHVFDMYDEDSR